MSDERRCAPDAPPFGASDEGPGLASPRWFAMPARKTVEGLTLPANSAGTSHSIDGPQLRGRWTCCDVYVTAPTAWWAVGAVTAVVYLLNGPHRVEVARQLLSTAKSTALSDSRSGLVAWVRGRPCDGFIVELEGVGGATFLGAWVTLEAWGTESASGEAGGELLGDAMVNVTAPTRDARLVGWNGATWQRVKVDASGNIGTSAAAGAPATGAVTSVAQNAASVQLIAANAARKGLSISNRRDASGADPFLYLRVGGTAATTAAYTIAIAPGGYWEPPAGLNVTDAVQGIWGAAGTGAALVTEYT